MGGLGDSNDVSIKYYRVTNDISKNILGAIISISAVFVNVIQVGSNPTRYIGAGSILSLFGDNPFKILTFGFSDKKGMVIENGNVQYIFQGTLQERVDYFATVNDAPKVNINDYLEPITEEEFYNIKPE